MRPAALGPVALVAAAGLAALAWLLLRGGSVGEPAPRAKAVPPAEPPPAAPAVAAARQPEPPADGSSAAPPPASSHGESSVERHPEWKPVTLSVLDRATRADLKDVEVAVDSRSQLHSRQPIDESYEWPIAMRGDSPLTVPPRLAGFAVCTMRVRAKDHATAEVDLDFGSGGARAVLLDPGCELRVRVDAPSGDERLRLELRRIDQVLRWLDHRAAFARDLQRRSGDASIGLDPDHMISSFLLRRREFTETEPAVFARPILRAPPSFAQPVAGSGWIEFQHLPPGDWIAAVVAESAPERLRGAAGARLAAGDSAECTIEVAAARPPDSADVQGTIVLAPGWEGEAGTAAPNELRLEREFHRDGTPRDASRRTIRRFDPGDGEREFSFDAGDLVEGAWTASLPQYGRVTRFSVPLFQAARLRIEVGPPCDVDLAVVESGSGSLAPTEVVEYCCGEATGDGFRVERAPGDRHFHFRAPLDALHVRVPIPMPDEGDFFDARVFHLSPGLNEFSLTVTPRAVVRLTLTDGAAVVPYSDLCRVEANRVGGGGGIDGRAYQGPDDVRFILSFAGRYALRVLDLPGFADSEPVEIDAPAGKLTDVTIPLKRAQ
jgi:hypothetical protein